MAIAKKKHATTQKKAKRTREEIAREKEVLIQKLSIVFEKVMAYCRGRPPRLAANGSYQQALEYKDLVSKTRMLFLNKSGSANQLQNRINRLNEKLIKFQKFE